MNDIKILLQDEAKQFNYSDVLNAMRDTSEIEQEKKQLQAM